MPDRAALPVLLTLTLLGSIVGALSGCGRRPSPEPAAAPAAIPAATARQVGSTTLLPVAERWCAAYGALHPRASIVVSGGGSGAGLQALAEGSAELANSSRAITPAEARAAEARGIKPVGHLVAYDAIAVVVNKANPLTALKLRTLSDLYAGKIGKWDAVGAPGLGPVRLIRRDAASGTSAVFRERVICLGGALPGREYAASAVSQPSSQAVVSAVAQSKGALGYVGLGYVGPAVKVLGLVGSGSAAPVTPDESTVRSKRYPLTRPLYCYANATAAGEARAYLEFILSPAGQALVGELGYVPARTPAPAAGTAPPAGAPRSK